MKRRLICVAMAAAMLLAVFDCAALERPDTEVSAAACVVYDPWLEQMVFEKDARSRRPMASTTKIMTAALALALYDPGQQVTVEPQWCGIEGSSMYLKAGEQLTVEDLIYGLMLMSGNDAATALASLYSGNPEDFIALMNAQAQALGLQDTAFETPSGLDGEGHYSTAYDMARLAAWALENSTFAAIVSTRSATRAGRYMKNHNRLLRELEGCVGVKTGFTKASGRCLVTACSRQGRMLVVVTLDAPNDWRDHKALYHAAFDSVASRPVLAPGEVGAAALVGTVQGSCALYIDQACILPLSLAEAEQLSYELCGPRIWYGEAVQGEQWGMLKVRLEGKVVAQAPVMFARTVEAKAEPGVLKRLWQWLAELI